MRRENQKADFVHQRRQQQLQREATERQGIGYQQPTVDAGDDDDVGKEEEYKGIKLISSTDLPCPEPDTNGRNAMSNWAQDDEQ